MRPAWSVAHEFGEQIALRHRITAGADHRQIKVSWIDAMKFAGCHALVDNCREIFAGLAHRIAPQRARFLRLAMNDPINNQMVQRRILEQTFQQRRNPAPELVGCRFGANAVDTLALAQLFQRLKRRRDEQFRAIRKVIADQRRIDVGSPREFKSGDLRGGLTFRSLRATATRASRPTAGMSLWGRPCRRFIDRAGMVIRLCAEGGLLPRPQSLTMRF